MIYRCRYSTQCSTIQSITVSQIMPDDEARTVSDFRPNRHNLTMDKQVTILKIRECYIKVLMIVAEFLRNVYYKVNYAH